MRCASQESPAAPSAGISADEEGERDREAEQAILEAIEEDGMVEMEELEVRCVDGVVYLDGVLPGERQRRALHEVVETVLGFRETVDDTVIDRQPWERRERDMAPEWEKTEKEVQMEGEDEEVDAQTSLDTGEPMTPPDHLTPESP
jgi:hypothetical protein